jgi:hypothetical protein
MGATFGFLLQNNIELKAIADFARTYGAQEKPCSPPRLYQDMVRMYDDMGVMMATWFSDSRFLDPSGRPLPLRVGTGSGSLTHLLKVSGAKVKAKVAIELMRLSPSIKFENDGSLIALRRVFVLPKFEVARAAFVVERYLKTLLDNVSRRKEEIPLLLERSCYVTKVDQVRLARTLRAIDESGTAFMDFIDGEIESLRVKQSNRRSTDELGVLVFAWTKSEASKNVKKKITRKKARKKREAH